MQVTMGKGACIWEERKRAEPEMVETGDSVGWLTRTVKMMPILTNIMKILCSFLLDQLAALVQLPSF